MLCLPLRTGKDVGDHPPITPMRCASRQELSGDSWRLYEYIVQHFIGSVSQYILCTLILASSCKIANTSPIIGDCTIREY